MSKILIGVPTYKGHKYCFEEFAKALKEQTISADVLFVVNNKEDSYARWIKSQGFSVVENPKPAKTPKEHIVNNRNYLRDYLLGLDYDYLFLVSSDVILPPFALEELIMEKKDIMAGPYLKVFKLGEEAVVAPKLFKDVEGGAQLYNYKGMYPARIMEIGAGGLGCVLISRKVLEKVSFESQADSDDEIKFYLSAKEKGFKPYANTGVRCVHIPKDKKMLSHFEWNTNYEDPVVEIDLDKIKQK
jgi:hypothetical protein